MQILRRIAVGFASFLLPITLFWFGVGFSLWQVLGTPAHIKNALQQNNLYGNVVQDALNQAQSEHNQAGDLPLDQPQIQAIIKQALPASLLQNSTNQILDGTYFWLQGKSTTPNFTVDLSAQRQQLADGVANYVQQRIPTLPICSLANLPTSIDAVTATCIPPGFNAAAAVEQARQQVLTSDALSRPVITNSTFKNDAGQPLSQSFKRLPAAYQHVKTALWILGVLSIALALVIVFLHATRRSGLRRTARIALGTGLSSVAVALAIAFLAQYVSNKAGHELGSDQALAARVLEVVRILITDMRNWWVGYGILLIALGLGTILMLKFMNRQTETQSSPLPKLPTPAAGEGRHSPEVPLENR